MSDEIFEFGDVVNYYPYGDREFVLEEGYSNDYPVRISIHNGGHMFTSDGRRSDSHTIPSLKLVRKNKKEAEVVGFYKIRAISTSPFFMTMRDEVFGNHIDTLGWIKKNGVDSWEYQIEKFYKVKE